MPKTRAIRPLRGHPPPIDLLETAPPTEAVAGRRHETRYICPACAEHLIYRERRCASCNEESPVYNLPVFWYWFYAILSFGIACIAYLMAT